MRLVLATDQQGALYYKGNFKVIKRHSDLNGRRIILLRDNDPS